MDAEDQEFNRIEMESRIKQEYIRAMRKKVDDDFDTEYAKTVTGLMEELAVASVLIREMGDRLAKLEAERNFCQRCGKYLFDGHIHTCTPPMEKNT